MDEEGWERQAKNLIRAELMRRGMSQERLLEQLRGLGVEETLASFRKKLSRGRFTTVFFLQVMAALGVDWIRLPAAPGTPEGDEAAAEHGAQRLARGERHRDRSGGSH